MNEITTIGIDLAKNVFQVHGVDASGAVVAAIAASVPDASVFRSGREFAAWLGPR